MDSGDPDSGFNLKCFMRGNISNDYYMGAQISDEEERFNARHRIKYLECEICHKNFSHQAHLKKHKAVLHDPQGTHKCEICLEKFRSKSHLLKHTHKKHSEDQTFECKVCSTKFKTKGMLNEHKKKHLSNHTLECEICQKKFRWQSRLNKHLESHKKKLPELSCHICQKKISQKHNLARHIKTHNEESEQPEKNVSGRDENDSDRHLSEIKVEPCYGDDFGHKMETEFVKVEELQHAPMETNIEHVFVKNECEIKIEKSEIQYEN